MSKFTHRSYDGNHMCENWFESTHKLTAVTVWARPNSFKLHIRNVSSWHTKRQL